jgi:hypothetical protein
VGLWEDHLLPLLTCKEVARLGCTCKALRGVVREHFRDLGVVSLDDLQAALTTFPRARMVMIGHSHYEPDDTEVEALVQWLREEGRGGGLERVVMPRSFEGPCEDLDHRALQAGALPSLKTIYARLEYPLHRASLTHGLVAAMHELRVRVLCDSGDVDLRPQLAALGLVRQLPALAKLEVSSYVNPAFQEPARWPPFIPPSLKALRVLVGREYPKTSLLRALPGMLGASGARLDRLEVKINPFFKDIGDGLVHLAQVLRCCSPTLTSFRLETNACIRVDPKSEDYADQVERLRVQWADVLAGVSACRELQVLVLPAIEVGSLFPSGTAFGRLTHLDISDHGEDHTPDAGGTGVWELMASGGLPALAKLDVFLQGRWGGAEEVRSRVVPALDGVAGTLTHLHLVKHYGIKWVSDEFEMGYEFGVAVGKLRRLKDLSLVLSRDGGVYHAVAQGLAASGEEHPLPLLWRVKVGPDVRYNADLLASLLLPLPSVRVFRASYSHIDHQALLTACAMRQVGYKHIWILPRGYSDDIPAIRAIAPCTVIRESFDWERAGFKDLE